MKTVGIIGFGSFGKFLAEKLSSHAKITVYSESGRTSSWAAPLEEVARSDYLILAVPLSAYEQVLGSVKEFLRPDTVIVDVCSVKLEPMKKIKSILPNQPCIATHPMFGPESAGSSFDGHTLIMCRDQSSSQPYAEIKQFASQLGLEIVEISSDEHDREIAVVQGLTFFIARALKDMKLHEQQLHTPSFARLLNLAKLEEHHSSDLFLTIQNGNPHTAAVRMAFIENIQLLNQELKDADS